MNCPPALLSILIIYHSLDGILWDQSKTVQSENASPNSHLFKCKQFFSTILNIHSSLWGAIPCEEKPPKHINRRKLFLIQFEYFTGLTKFVKYTG